MAFIVGRVDTACLLQLQSVKTITARIGKAIYSQIRQRQLQLQLVKTITVTVGKTLTATVGKDYYSYSR
jgi:hypothetical protein